MKRLYYLDVLRGLAILFMVVDHAYDWWMDAAGHASPLATYTKFIGTLAAPLFLFLVGVGLTLSAVKNTEKGIGHQVTTLYLFRRGLIIIISDLYDEPLEVMRALRHFRHNKHQVIVFHVFDQAELDLPFNKLVTFVDMETQEKLQIDPKFIRDEYRRQIEDFIGRYRRDCSDSSIEYIMTPTATPYDVTLRSFLASRLRIAVRR